MAGTTLTSCLLNTGPVLLRGFVQRKDDLLTDEVELVEANPSYAVILFSDGWNSPSLSLR